MGTFYKAAIVPGKNGVCFNFLKAAVMGGFLVWVNNYMRRIFLKKVTSEQNPLWDTKNKNTSPPEQISYFNRVNTERALPVEI